METTQHGKHIPPAELIAYPHVRIICLVTMVEYYLQRTKKIRGVFIKLFISYMYPRHDGAERFLNRLSSMISTLHIQLGLQQFPKH